MHDYKSNPYDDTYMKEKLDGFVKAQKAALERGGLMFSDYGQYWFPRISDIPGAVYRGYGEYDFPFGKIEYDPDLSKTAGTRVCFIDLKPGAELPDILKPLTQVWYPAIGYVNAGSRTVTIRVPEAETEITFSKVNLGTSAYGLLQEVNEQLARANAGCWIWRLEASQGHENGEANDTHRHLFPDGKVPTISNGHTRATVTGYALSSTGYIRQLVYVGMAAHKTSCESIWASLISNGRSRPNISNTLVEPIGPIKMQTTPMPEYACIHAGVLSISAMPGQWTANDDVVHALVFAGEAGEDTEAALRRAAYKRLQEALPYPLKDEWEATVWEWARANEYITDLFTGGDCAAGVEINLGKPWQDLLNNLISAEELKF